MREQAVNAPEDVSHPQHGELRCCLKGGPAGERRKESGTPPPDARGLASFGTDSHDFAVNNTVN